MILLGNVGQEDASFCPFGDCVNLGTKQVHNFEPDVPWAWKSFWAHTMVLLGVMRHVEPRLGPFGGSVSLGAR